MRTTGKQCGLAATGVYQPSLRSPWLAAAEGAPVTFNLKNPPAFVARLARNLKWFRDNLQLNWHYWVV
ncbi:hypothetical protein, partial [Thiolapillus sp.]|uniref:hypothetical protein n=1 Tax=Thiolapillus sp. TaxID=2017437 RepID=UPI003AF83048